MFRTVLSRARSLRDYMALPPLAKEALRRDLKGLPASDPGPERVVDLAVEWLCRAQDSSASHDGGIARHFSLIHGWGPSYPETTGYIAPTMLNYARRTGSGALRTRVRRMLDWLVSIQRPDGAFPGGVIGEEPQVPVVFNTGQILLGLAAGAREWGDAYVPPMQRAADWLVHAQDADGCWRRYPSPFAMDGERTYDTHVAWGLLEAARITNRRIYGDAGLANVRWAISRQRSNGWVESCCLSDPSQPLTHTLGYTLRGMLEAYRFTPDAELLAASVKVADGLLSALEQNGFLPGRLDAEWKGTVRWACLTGTVQIAFCWFYLFELSGKTRYLEAAREANRFVRRSVALDGPPGIRGGVKGAFPICGAYGTWEYLNWACNFFIESNLYELDLRTNRGNST